MLGQGPPFPKAAFAAYQARHPPPPGVINPYITMASGGEIPKKGAFRKLDMSEEKSLKEMADEYNERKKRQIRTPPRLNPKRFGGPPPPPPPSAGLTRALFEVGGTVPGLMLRKPTSHAMAGVTSFMPHYKGMSHSFNPTNQNFAQATFVQGGYFPQADHRLI